MGGILLALVLFAPGDTTPDGIAVLARMHERYAASWYATIAVVQAVTYLDSLGGVDHAEIWYKSLALPGTIRSDLAPLDAGRGELFRGDSVYRFEGDTVVERGPAVHTRLLLGFDVYRQPVDRTAETLASFGFDLAVVRADTTEGRAGWVVGAEEGPQFWVDQEDFLLRRLAMPGGEDRPPRDIRFEEYRRVGDGWLATEVVFLTGGVPRIREHGLWWEDGLAFDQAVFATMARTRPGWVWN